ncbi:MAG: hypothetical protein JXR88_00640 [Clostridia bacterium]|nr:hypothetical protein [Clostridia bacterium]
MRKLLLVLLLLLMAIPVVFAEEEVVVTIPDSDVYLNGILIDNTTEKYPFIVYNNITYIPMTWDFASSLGLQLQWSSETGLKIEKKSDMNYYEQKNFGKYVIGKKYKATIITSPVEVNGKAINNALEKYPILNFNNITYFPMTWNFMVDEFNSGYQWDNKIGLSVSADPKLKKEYPKPLTDTFTVYTADLMGTEVYVNKNIKLRNLNTNWILSLYYDNATYNNRLMNVFIDYYDEKGKFIFTEVHKAGLLYEYSESPHHGGIGIALLDGVSKMDFRFEYINRNAAMAQLKEDLGDVKIEIISTRDFSKEIFEDAEYFATKENKCTELFFEDDLEAAMYNAFYYPSGALENGEPAEIVYMMEDNILTVRTEAYPVIYDKVSAFSDFKLNLNKNSLQLEKTMNGRVLEDEADFIYLYDANKNWKRL